MSGAWVAGVDAGGTGTRARLRSPDGRTAEGQAGPANPGRVGYAGSIAAVAAAVADALARLEGNAQPENVCVHAGIAGAGRPADLEALGAVPHPFRAFGFESDAALTLRAAFPQGPGCVLIVGTGCLALRRDAGGSLRRAGGWGFPVEVGGGSWLGVEALRLALTAAEAGVPSTLWAALAPVVGPVDRAPAWIREAGPSGFAGLAPLAIQAAGEGDRDALALLRDWGERLAGLLLAAHRPGPLGPWAAWGGLSGPAAAWLPSEALVRRVPMGSTPLDAALAEAQNLAARGL